MCSILRRFSCNNFVQTINKRPLYRPLMWFMAKERQRGNVWRKNPHPESRALVFDGSVVGFLWSGSLPCDVREVGRTRTDGNTAKLQRLHCIRSKGWDMNQTDHDQRSWREGKKKALLINAALLVLIEGGLADLKATYVTAAVSESATCRITRWSRVIGSSRIVLGHQMLSLKYRLELN